VDDAGIRAADSFEVVVRHVGRIDASNVVVHGLGRETIDAGVAPELALDALRRWIDGAPCIAFHAEFDRRVLDRAASLAGASRLAGPWLDLAPLASLLYPDVARTGGGALDDWLSALQIVCVSRHNAASDALASAELLLALRSMAAARGAYRFDDLVALTRSRRWLGNRP
jgi:DNA polymerase III subunit epsilon